jgi:ribosomal protein L16 Arg81 hydroxylase
VPHRKCALSRIFQTASEGFIVGPGDIVHFPPHAWHEAVALDDVLEIDVFWPIRPQLLGPLTAADGTPVDAGA